MDIGCHLFEPFRVPDLLVRHSDQKHAFLVIRFLFDGSKEIKPL